jgi:hypothetical protein
MNKIKFIKTMREKVAVSAVGPSALRGQGKGVLYSTQKVLKRVNLLKLPVDSQDDFHTWLDKQTATILGAMPINSNPWGAARKALNLFLRDVLYNRYLCKEYGINKVEYWLEIPLDSAVAEGLMKRARDIQEHLPRWPRLKHLTKDDSDKYQRFAERLATQERIARVHLDMTLWLENRRTEPDDARGRR